VAPVTNNEIIWALSFGALFRGLLVATITFICGTLFYYMQKSDWLVIDHPLILIFFAITAGLMFGQIGICVAFWAKSFDQLSAFSAFILLPLTYLGGVFISLEHLSPFWQSVSRLNPLLYLINGLRYGFLGVSDVEISHAVVISLIGLVFFYGMAQVSLRKGSFQRW
jgi:ABC-2 type transport system permease protein